MAAEKLATYKIIAKTSLDIKEGSTDASVSIQMIGNNGKNSTNWHVLDNLFRDDFELGRTDHFTIKARDVGIPEVIRLKIDKSKEKSGWHCESVSIKYESAEMVIFSIYDWVYGEITACYGKARISQNETSPLMRDLRRIEVERNKCVFQWHVLPTENHNGWSLPRYCYAEDYKELPLLFRINDEQFGNFQSQRQIALFNILMNFAKNLVVKNKLHDLEEYRCFFCHPSLPKEMPPFFECWETDEEFGRQILNGVNPTTITKCTEVPQQFLKEEEAIFSSNVTFEAAMKENRLFIINYRDHSSGVDRNTSKTGQQLYCADPICLFVVGEDKKLRPFAIELEEDGPIFTRHDYSFDWMLAKLYFRNTDVNIHEWKFHFLRTHAIMEPFAIGLFRSFSRRHPLYKLLRPHLQTIPAINTLARNNLIGPKAATNFSLSINGVQMARRAFQTLEYEDLVIANIFKAQGTDNREELPYYNYRDDALLLWEAVHNYVKNVLQVYYSKEEDFTNDVELNDFVRTVAIDGIAWAGFGLKGFPTQITEFNKLVEYVTMIVFTCSVQHAASNFGQFEIYKFVPNAPGGMRLPPHKKGEGSLQRVLDSLPDHIMSVLQLGTSFTLSSYAPNEVYLGHFPMKLFLDEEIEEHHKKFRKDLKEISTKITERNKTLSIPYTYLLPDRIPNSIAV